MARGGCARRPVAGIGGTAGSEGARADPARARASREAWRARRAGGTTTGGAASAASRGPAGWPPARRRRATEGVAAAREAHAARLAQGDAGLDHLRRGRRDAARPGVGRRRLVRARRRGRTGRSTRASTRTRASTGPSTRREPAARPSRIPARRDRTGDPPRERASRGRRGRRRGPELGLRGSESTTTGGADGLGDPRLGVRRGRRLGRAADAAPRPCGLGRPGPDPTRPPSRCRTSRPSRARRRRGACSRSRGGRSPMAAARRPDRVAAGRLRDRHVLATRPAARSSRPPVPEPLPLLSLAVQPLVIAALFAIPPAARWARSRRCGARGRRRGRDRPVREPRPERRVGTAILGVAVTIAYFVAMVAGAIAVWRPRRDGDPGGGDAPA